MVAGRAQRWLQSERFAALGACYLSEFTRTFVAKTGYFALSAADAASVARLARRAAAKQAAAATTWTALSFGTTRLFRKQGFLGEQFATLLVMRASLARVKRVPTEVLTSQFLLNAGKSVARSLVTRAEHTPRSLFYTALANSALLSQ